MLFGERMLTALAALGDALPALGDAFSVPAQMDSWIFNFSCASSHDRATFGLLRCKDIKFFPRASTFRTHLGDVGGRGCARTGLYG